MADVAAQITTKLNRIMYEVSQIKDPVEQTIAWTAVMSWLQDELPKVRVDRRDAAKRAKDTSADTYNQLARKLGMTEATVRRLVSEAGR